MKPTLEVVVGAQFGSEAKGHVVQRLTERAMADKTTVPQVVRVAGPNAGHTGYDTTGRSWALRQVPVAAVVPGPVVLGIAAGSEIDPPVLLEEIDALRDAGLLINKVLWVSGMATVITDWHKQQESNHNLVASIGSTGKGIGAARAQRIMREAQLVRDSESLIDALADRGVAIADTNHSPLHAMHGGSHMIIEGTQGYGLGLHTRFYPQCTSSNCRAIDFMAMAGVNPWEFERVGVWAVARMFPIRVAGNSGPLKDETTWEALGLPYERTTVTKKVRRVGQPDWDLVAAAVRANGGGENVRLAITMVDQMFPLLRDIKLTDLDSNTIGTETHDEYYRMDDYLKRVEREVRAPIGMITTGPNTASYIGGF